MARDSAGRRHLDLTELRPGGAGSGGLPTVCQGCSRVLGSADAHRLIPLREATGCRQRPSLRSERVHLAHGRPRPSTRCARPPRVLSMTDSSEVKVLYPARWRRRVSEAQGRRREAGSEGSVEQSRDPMDKNRIRGLPGRTSERDVAKSAAIKGRGGKSGGDAAKAVGLTSGGLRRVRNSGTERVRKAGDRGAEVSRGHGSRLAGEGPNDGQGQ